MDSKTFNSKKYGVVVVSRRRTRSANKFSTPTVVTKDEAAIIQAQMGYAPQGYHFENYKTDINGTKWSCWTSCD